MSKADWGYLFLAWVFVFWWFAAGLHWLGRRLEYSTYCIRKEMAELLGKKERADELREEDNQDAKDRAKARWQEAIGAYVICAGWFAWWWYTGALPFASVWHAAG
jgi:hypothetical protein